MQEFEFEGRVVRLYTDAREFVDAPEKPFGDIPAEWEPDASECQSTGFTTLDDKIIRVFVSPDCPFDDLLSTCAHELGHLVEGGFRKNPPDKPRWFNRHEAKAEHYENFVLSAYRMAVSIWSISHNIGPTY